MEWKIVDFKCNLLRPDDLVKNHINFHGLLTNYSNSFIEGGNYKPIGYLPKTRV